MVAAAELLRKGGTLVKEPCGTCGGVQVKYSGKIVCVNCGKEEAIKSEAKVETKPAAVPDVVNDLRNTVLAKVNELLPALKSESDIGRQSELANLLLHYLEILAKLPKDDGSRQ